MLESSVIFGLNYDSNKARILQLVVMPYKSLLIYRFLATSFFPLQFISLMKSQIVLLLLSLFYRVFFHSLYFADDSYSFGNFKNSRLKMLSSLPLREPSFERKSLLSPEVCVLLEGRAISCAVFSLQPLALTAWTAGTSGWLDESNAWKNYVLFITLLLGTSLNSACSPAFYTTCIFFPHVWIVSKDRRDLMLLLKTQTFSLLPPIRMLHTDQDSELWLVQRPTDFSSSLVLEYILVLSFSSYFKVLVAQSCPTLCDPKDCSLPGPSVHGIPQAGILAWVAMPFSRASSWPRDQTRISCTAGRFFYHLSHQGIWLLTEKEGSPLKLFLGYWEDI